MGASFNFTEMIKGLESYASEVKTLIADLEKSASSGQVDLSKMFSLQFKMQIMAQYTEAMSNVLTSINGGMMGMARAIRGQ